MTDEEFQHHQTILRYAPWLDIVKLRERLREWLLESLESGPLSRKIDEYKNDVYDYCDGKLKYVPRSMSIHSILVRQIPRDFPEASRDPKLAHAIEEIASHIQTPMNWDYDHRGQNERIE